MFVELEIAEMNHADSYLITKHIPILDVVLVRLGSSLCA